MASQKLSQSVLEKIKQEQITPRPRWQFWLRNTVFWLLFVLCAFYGGRVIGVLLYISTAFEPELMMQAHGPLLPHVIRMLPLFWLSFFILLALAAIYGFHHTKKGYKVSMKYLVLGNVIISLLIGSSAFVLGDSERFEEAMYRRAPLFEKVEQKREKLWSKPDEGRLAGKIQELHDDQIIILNDFMRQQWTVKYSGSEQWVVFTPQQGMTIRVVGMKIGDSQFQAKIISPWQPQRQVNRLVQQMFR